MNSEPFQSYKHSGKFGVHGPLLALVVGTIAAFPLGFAYAYLVKWIPFVYVNFFATLGYGFLFGWLTGKFMKMGKVRNGGVAALTGLALGTIAWYFAWNGSIHATFAFEKAPIIFKPLQVVRAMEKLYEVGSWGLKSGGPLTGIPLAIVWLVEAGMIVGITTAVGYGMISELPYCETSQCWLDEKKNIDTIERFVNPEQLAAFKAGDLGPLTQARPRTPGSGAWTRLLLKHSPNCQVFHTIRLQDITIEVDKNGNPKEKATDLSGDLVLPASMFELISKFEHFSAPPPPSPAG